MRRYQALGEDLGFDFLRANPLAGIERPNSLLQSFLKRAADGHHFADGLHLWSKRFVGARKLFKLPLRNFDDHVIECGLEAGWSLPRNVVRNLVERIADGKLGLDFRNREPGGF